MTTTPNPLKIFYWMADESGCGTYRCKLPAQALQTRGHTTTYSTIMPAEYQDNQNLVDIIIAQRTCNPAASTWWQKTARKEDRPLLVFEVDDDLWHVDPSNRHAYAWYGQPGIQQALVENIRVADAVTVTTEPLADVVSQWNDSVHVVPNQVPAWMLDHQRPVDTDLVTIGWRGSDTHSRDFGELAKPLRRFLQHPTNRDRVEFHAMGANYTARVATRHGRTRWTGWHPDVDDFLRGIDFDVAVIPLRDSVFNASKSELALLEMSALGIPAVVSPVGPYARMAGQVPGLRLAATAGAWEQHLADLTDETPGQRAQTASRLRAWAASRTYEGNAWRWEHTYQAALSSVSAAA